MSFHFDVLREPWIPVTDRNGQARQMGILDVLEHAHELLAITDASPLVEYGLHRLLCVFLMDALRPEEIFDIEDLLDEGQFDMEKILDYVELCRSEGAGFDLFDEKRPFLQTPFSKEWDKDTKPVSYLDCTIPTGDNHVHFNHMKNPALMSYAEAAKYLPVCLFFATSAGKGYSPGPNGYPPYYSLIKGHNLFETLVDSMLPIDEISDFDSKKVIWRSEPLPGMCSPVVNVSWLYGMILPVRRIQLIPEEDGVREMYYGPGVKLLASDTWIDPHVTYYSSKKGRFPWRPNGDRAVWRNLNDLVDVSEKKHAPETFSVYSQRCAQNSGQMNVCLYGVQVTNNCKFEDLFYHDLQIPTSLMREGRAALVGVCIGEAEELANQLARSMQCPGVPQETGKEAAQTCYQLCETALWDLCGRELSADEIDGEAVLAKWKLQLYSIGKTVSAQMLDRLNLTGREWIETYQRQERFYKHLLKLRKEGEMTDGGQ